MIKELIKLANELDNKGLAYEADILDSLAAKIAAADEVSEYEVLAEEEPMAQEKGLSDETAAYKIELSALMLDSENWTPEDKALLSGHVLNRNIDNMNDEEIAELHSSIANDSELAVSFSAGD